MGRFGATVDNVLAFELVTADGQIRTASADEHPDLFWALRGGGGNFGVGSYITYRLHELGPVLGGMLVFPLLMRSGIEQPGAGVSGWLIESGWLNVLAYGAVALALVGLTRGRLGAQVDETK